MNFLKTFMTFFFLFLYEWASTGKEKTWKPIMQFWSDLYLRDSLYLVKNEKAQSQN